jgi:hypothetical protein
MFRNSARQVGSKFPFDEKRHGTVTLLLPGEECLELFGGDLVQDAFFRMARNVFKRSALHAQ